MMESKIISGQCREESKPTSASARNTGIPGSLKIRTPAEINNEFDATSIPVSASRVVDSFDRHTPHKTPYLFCPSTIPSISIVSTATQPKRRNYKELLANVKEIGCSAAAETIPSASRGNEQKKQRGFNFNLPLSFPRNKTWTDTVVFKYRDANQVVTSDAQKTKEKSDSYSSGQVQINPLKLKHTAERLKLVNLGNLITQVIRPHPTPSSAATTVPAMPASQKPGGGSITEQGGGTSFRPRDLASTRPGGDSSTIAGTRSRVGPLSGPGGGSWNGPEIGISGESGSVGPGSGPGCTSKKYSESGENAKQTGLNFPLTNSVSKQVSLTSSPAKTIVKVKKACKRVREVWHTAKPGDVNAKIRSTSKSPQSIHQLSKVSKYPEEDKESSHSEFNSIKQNVNSTSNQSVDVYNKISSKQIEISKTCEECEKVINEVNENENKPYSGLKEKMDENYNIKVKLNNNCNIKDMNSDTGTDDGGRENLLEGVVLTLSGYENPLRGQIISKAVAMGAEYRTGWTNECSHLVCGFPGTFKYLQAKGRGKIVLGTWIEDCYKSRKKIDWKKYILSEEKIHIEPTKVTSGPSDRLRFLAGMEVRLKDSCLFKKVAGKAAIVRGMYHDWVQVVVPGFTHRQLLISQAEMEHRMPEKGDKAKCVMKGQGENTMEVLSVDEVQGIAVVRYDGYKGAIVQLKHLCRIAQDENDSET